MDRRTPVEVEEDDISDEELSNDEESFHERSHSHSRTHSTCHNSSNCINIYTHYNDPGASDVEHAQIRRSASGVFRCTNELDTGSFHDEPLLLENGCHVVYSPHHLLQDDDDVDLHVQKDPFDG